MVIIDNAAELYIDTTLQCNDQGSKFSLRTGIFKPYFHVQNFQSRFIQVPSIVLVAGAHKSVEA